MPIVRSLRDRIFLACASLAVLSLGCAFAFVNARAGTEAETALRRELREAAALLEENRALLSETFTKLARAVADLPKLKSAVDTGDAPTVEPLAAEYRALLGADLLLVSDPRGDTLAAVGEGADALPRPVGAGEIARFLPHDRGLLQVVSVPIVIGVEPTELLGRVTAGFFFDDRTAARFRALTASDVAFAAGGRILASSLPNDLWEQLQPALEDDGITPLKLGAEEYLALARPVSSPAMGASSSGGPVILVLRSRTERLRFLNTLRTGVVGALIVTVLVATILSYAVARTMTRPLAAITGAMREIAATGDLTRKAVVRSGPWDDEDARLLASTFNALTESVSRFQAEAAQRERLSSLGRLSTVVAHEIRNPLMIIRATLASLRREPVSPVDLREAVADIDEETTRLNRIVTDVLDFAKPIRFELAPASLNDICRESAAAVWADTLDEAPGVALELEPQDVTILTDRERLRTALVNILTNARAAVCAPVMAESADGRHPATPQIAAVRCGVVVRTARAVDRVIVTVDDAGSGIAPEDIPHIFDPYFTTRRRGTGLGLPIARNIVEGLGGTLTARSTQGIGTQIRIELPAAPEVRT